MESLGELGIRARLSSPRGRQGKRNGVDVQTRRSLLLLSNLLSASIRHINHGARECAGENKKGQLNCSAFSMGIHNSMI